MSSLLARTHHFPQEYAGKKLLHVLDLRDRNGELEDRSGEEAWGKVVDETGATVFSFTPCPGDGTFAINHLIPTSVAAGRYEWRAGISESDGGEGHVLFQGKIHISAY